MTNLPGHLTPTQISIVEKSLERLRALNDHQIIMLALANIIEQMDQIGPGMRLPLSINLKERAGVKE